MKIVACVLCFCTLVSSLCNRNFGPTDALIIIDVQNGFLPNRTQLNGYPVYPPLNMSYVDAEGHILAGSLAVNDANEIIPVINDWINDFTAANAPVMASLDWHPPNSCSFCSTPNTICGGLGVTECGLDGNASPGCPQSVTHRCLDSVSISDYMDNAYVQWPSHCVEGSWSAQFDAFLEIPKNAVIVKKGFLVQNDSYSAYGGRLSVSTAPFYQPGDTASDLVNQPDLKTLIENYGITRLFVSGIATDFCVKNTILDSLGVNVAGKGTQPTTLDAPFSVSLILAAARGVAPGTVAAAIAEVQSAGAVIIPSTITDPNQALQYYCDFVDAQGESSSGHNNNLAIGLGIGLTVMVLAVVAIVCVFCNHRKSAVPKSTDYTGGETRDDSYKPLNEL